MALAESHPASAAMLSKGRKQPPANGVYTELETLLNLRFFANELQLKTIKNSRASVSGGVRTRFRGRGMEFEEVRVYHPGDDIRTIDWRVTARTQVPHTKVFREERERPTFIAADQRSNLFFGSQRCFKSVLCAQLASILAWAALQNNDRVGGMVFGNHEHSDIRPRRSKHAVLEFIHHLNDYNHALSSPLISDREVTLTSMLEDLRRLAKPGSAVYLVSDFLDYNEECDEQLYLLSRHTDVTLFQVFDPLEKNLPNKGLLSVTNGAERLQIHTNRKRFRDNYAEHIQQRFDLLEQQCKRLKTALFRFSCSDNEFEQLRSIYARRKSR